METFIKFEFCRRLSGPYVTPIDFPLLDLIRYVGGIHSSEKVMSGFLMPQSRSVVTWKNMLGGFYYLYSFCSLIMDYLFIKKKHGFKNASVSTCILIYILLRMFCDYIISGYVCNSKNYCIF